MLSNIKALAFKIDLLVIHIICAQIDFFTFTGLLSHKESLEVFLTIFHFLLNIITITLAKSN